MITSLNDESGHLDFSGIASKYTLCQSPSEASKTPQRTQRARLMSSIKTESSAVQPQSDYHTDYPIKLEAHPLLKSLKKYRVERLVKLFSEKLKRNVVLSTPAQQDQENQESVSLLWRLFGEKEGLDMNSFWVVVVDGFGLSIVTWLMIMYSLVLVFRSVEETEIFRISQYVALLFYTLEIFLNFFLKQYQEGKAINEIRLICLNYFNNSFLIHLAFVVLLIVDMSMRDSTEMCYIRMAIIIKFLISLPKIATLESFICTNSRRQQQWGLVLVFIVNFFFAHILSISLNSMAYLGTNDNWWIRRGIDTEMWYVKYVWGYYWGINIMLTVGFGDLVATNWQEALCLIFIEMISCIIFSYNINCVGNLINNLKLQQVEKQKNLKNFRRMCRFSSQGSTGLSDLEGRISHFIEKSIDIKHNNDTNSQGETLSLLPQRLKVEFLLKVNAKIIQSSFFFKDLNRKCIEDIALRLEKRISLPQEIVIRKGDQSKLTILIKGEAAYIAYQQKRGKKQHIMIERISSDDNNSNFKLLSFRSFIKRKQQKFDVMTTDYAVLYSLEQEPFYEALRQHKLDYQRYCHLRDDQGWEELTQGFECAVCRVGSHTKFQCPRLHYIPLRQLISLKSKRIGLGQGRNSSLRGKRRSLHFGAVLQALSWNCSIDSYQPKSNMNLMQHEWQQQPRNTSGDLQCKTMVPQLDRMYVWKYYCPWNNMPVCLRGYRH